MSRTVCKTSCTTLQHLQQTLGPGLKTGKRNTDSHSKNIRANIHYSNCMHKYLGNKLEKTCHLLSHDF
jgi:hypothetical protein